MMETSKNMDKKQRARSSNWTADMKESLRQLIEPKLNIIDSKENNLKFIKLKFDAWKSIEENMKALDHNIPIQKLKEQWSRMKMQARSTIAEYKRAKFSTRGGECPEEPPELDFLISEMNPKDFEIDCAMFDSDQINQLDKQKEKNAENENEKSENIIIIDNNKNAGNEKSENLIIKDNNKFKRKRKTATLQTGEEMINSRIKLIKMEGDHEQVLFSIRLEMEQIRKKHLEKMNELEIKIKEEEFEARKKENALLSLRLERERRILM